MNDVCVLMSTYNGEAYLTEQLDSVFDQHYEGSIHVLIRDDGSGDGTKALVRGYPQKENRSIELIEGENVGPQRSFLELIRISPKARFYFFADQDDIWYPDKIQSAVRQMKSEDIPTCVCTNYDIYNSDSGLLNERYLKEEPPFRPLKIIFYNQIPGCTMGFNDRLMELLKQVKVENVMMHDSMALSLAAVTGVVYFDTESSIKHRIHGKNVVGEGHKKIIPHKWLVEKTKLVLQKDDYDLGIMADQFLETGAVKAEWRADLELLRDYKKNFGNTIRLLRHPDSHDVFGDRTTMSIRCKIFFHVF